MNTILNIELLILVLIIILNILIVVRKINIINKLYIELLFSFIGGFYVYERLYKSNIIFIVALIMIYLLINIIILIVNKTSHRFYYYLFNINSKMIISLNSIIEKHSIDNKESFIKKRGFQYYIQGNKNDFKDICRMKDSLNNYVSKFGNISLCSIFVVVVLVFTFFILRIRLK